MRRRVPVLLVGAVGVVLIVWALAARLFTAGPAFERVTDGFRPEMRASELAALRTDLAALDSTQKEFTSKVIPQLAAAQGVTQQQLAAVLGQQFPAVAAGLQRAPEIVAEFSGTLDVLDAEQGRFRGADAIPTKSLPATTVPWGLLGVGLLCLALVFLIPRLGAALAVGVGVLMLAVPLLLSLPSKAGDADTMNSNLKPVYTAELVSTAKASLAGMQAMGAEMQEKLLPGLGQMLGMSQAQVGQFLAGNFPDVTAGMARIPGALARFDRMVGAFDRSLDDYDTAKGTSLLPIVWALMVGGVVVAGSGGWVLARRLQAIRAAAPREAPATDRTATAA